MHAGRVGLRLPKGICIHFSIVIQFVILYANPNARPSEEILWQLCENTTSATHKPTQHKGLKPYLACGVLLCVLRGTVSLVLRRIAEHVEVHALARPDLEDARLVSAAIAVVRRGPDRRKMAVEETRVAFHAELVRTQDVHEPVHLQELVHDARAERVPCPARADRKVFLLCVWVGPHQVRDRALVRDLCERTSA
jgi:hypothetical protein